MKWGTVWDPDRRARILERVACTETAGERMRGLLGRPPLGAEEGLWIAPCSSVHTFGMTYPLDLAYLGRGGKILRLVRGLRPRRLSACLGARVTLEMPAGTIEGRGLERGSRLVWCPGESPDRAG